MLSTTLGTLTNSINRFGYNVPGFDLHKSHALQYIKASDQHLLFQINTSLESYNDLINDDIIPEESERDQTERHVKKFLNKFNLTVDERAFDDISDKSLVEVYSLGHQQLYRSLNFFSLSSYDLAALTFIPWDKLFYRSEEDTMAMFKSINYLLDNDISYMTPTIPMHFLTELCSGKKFGYRMLKLATVRDAATNAPMGYLTIISVKQVLDTFQILH